MATYPLPTLAATVTDTGITAPSYADILNSLQASFQSIYGSDAYLEADSQDGQLLAIFAKAISDCNDATIAAYHSRGPLTAIGEGLSSVVKINGISRALATNSQVSLRVSGAVGTVITNGQARDSSGNVWKLPTTVTIPSGGLVTVTALAAEVGDIRAEPNTVTIIGTPTAGWNSVTNLAAAIPGVAIESDAALRTRQAVSTGLSANGILSTMLGTLLNVASVTKARIYENNSNTTDANGIPAKTLAVVVSGGAANDVADAIMYKRNPGVGMFGSTTVNRTDNVGQVQAIKFTIPTQVTIKVALELAALTGYTTEVGDRIKAALVDHFNSLPIGTTVYWSRAFKVAMLNDPVDAATYEINTFELFRDSDPPAQNDVLLDFDENPRGLTANITITVV